MMHYSPFSSSSSFSNAPFNNPSYSPQLALRFLRFQVLTHYLAAMPRRTATFVTPFASPPFAWQRRPRLCPLAAVPVARSSRRVRMVTTADPLGLPARLREYVDALATAPTPQLRYKQLLYMAAQLPPMRNELKTEAARVHGCTSVVHVHVALDEEGRVLLEGDSDAQLTKGLLALLVNGLKGVKPEEVGAVQGSFIDEAGLAVSLTPSRNNGFVNMLAKIKESVSHLEKGGPGGGLEEEAGDGGAEGTGEGDDDDVPGRPLYSAIMRKLRALKPVVVEVRDDSAQHAGHAGAKGLGGESHFAVHIVAEAFAPLSLVQRHRLIYTLLAEEMAEGGVHALAIDAKTPAEAGL